jgi:3-ketosteroid 9alpha-monooxygenase subunit B
MTSATTNPSRPRRHSSAAPDVFVAAKLTRVIDETSECRSFELKLPASVQGQFVGRPGQFLRVWVRAGELACERSYSLSSTPTLGESPRITVKRIPGGRVSNWFNDTLRPGSVIEVAPPGGRFVLRSSTKPILMFAAGSGITPVFSLLRHVLALTDLPAVLVQVNRSPTDAIFRSSLLALRHSLSGRFEFIEHFTGARGRLTADDLRALCAARDGFDVYTCGPEAFMALIEYCAIECGLPDDRVFHERFVTPQATATEHDISMGAASHAEVEARVHVMIDGQRHAYTCAGGQTVLDGAIEAGLQLPHSCREGRCGTCLVKLMEGSVHMPRSQGISKRERERGFVLACQSVPSDPILTIDYDA